VGGFLAVQALTSPSGAAAALVTPGGVGPGGSPGGGFGGFGPAFGGGPGGPGPAPGALGAVPPGP